MRFIVKTCPQRSGYIPYLKERIPNLEVVVDPGGGVMDCFQESLRVAGEDAVVHLEDDIVLTENFCEKALAVIADFPYVLIQFFSMRKKDLEIGSRWEPGRTFLMNQCVYYPEGMSRDLLEYSEDWFEAGNGKIATDDLVALFLRGRGMDYYLHVPSLVDHRVGRSVSNPKRSSKRQSLTFQSK